MLDARTLLFAGGVGQALAAVLLVGVAAVHRREIATRYWALAYFLLALSSPLFVLRGFISDFLSIVVANSMAVGGAFCIFVGMAAFERHRRHWKVGAVLVAAVAVGCTYWTYVDPRVPARVLVTNAAMAVPGLMCAVFIFATRRRGQTGVRLALSVMFFALVAGNVVRIVDSLLGWREPVKDLFAVPLLSIWLALTFCLVFLSATGFVVLIQLRVQDRLDRLANFDALTGLLNRRAFRRAAVRELRRILRGAPAGYLLVLDMDHFKSLNDQFGHVAGDRALRAFAVVLTAALPDGAVAGRLGGDEFCALLPGADLAQACAFAERVRVATELLEVRFGPAIVRTRVSIGLGALAGARTFNEALRRADDALYRAKSAGRNAVSEADARWVSAA